MKLEQNKHKNDLNNPHHVPQVNVSNIYELALGKNHDNNFLSAKLCIILNWFLVCKWP